MNNSILTKAVLDKLREKISFSEAEPDRGIVYVLPPDMLDVVSEEEKLTLLQDHGIKIVHNDVLENAQLVGFSPWSLGELVPFPEVKLAPDPEPPGYSGKPTAMIRSGNNRKHASDSAAKRKMASLSKKKNRKRK